MLAFFLATLAAVSTLVTLFLHACAHGWLRRASPPGGDRPPVTILKPLKGVDDRLFRNLASFAELRYPRFQIVLGAEDPEDPALDVARRLQGCFPEVDIQVVAGAPALGRNPKVTNLASLARHAAHDLWLISDSNVKVERTYLRDIVAELQQPGVGMVCNVFAGTGENSPGALLENLHLNSWVAGGMCAAQVVTGGACVVGKSMLFDRANLERLGGWLAVKDILAEDYVLGVRMAEIGLRPYTSRHVIATVNESWSMRRFLNRHLRWAQIRRRGCAAGFFLEPLLNPVLFALAAAIAGHFVLGTCCMALKIVSDAILGHRLRGAAYPLRYLVWIPVKDLVIAGLWFVAVFRRKVWWRGNRLRIGAGTLLQPAPARH